MNRRALFTPNRVNFGMVSQYAISVTDTLFHFCLFHFSLFSQSLQRGSGGRVADPPPLGFVTKARVTFPRPVDKSPVTLGILGERSLPSGIPREFILMLP